MVVASGQLPYAYDGELPVRQRRGGWPGIEVPNIGPSGDLFEQGMFVLNAELRKWGINSLGQLTYKAYSCPNVASSGFEPKANGETFQGHVGRLALLTTNNIEQMRENLEVYLFYQYALDSDYDFSDFLRSWLNSAYPESPSGYPQFFYDWTLNFGVEYPATWLRPALTDVANGDFITDTDLHWLGGSGVLFDIDYGEVIFNPFPFPRQTFHFAPGLTPHMSFSFGPVYPLLQTTAGLAPSLNATRYQTDLSIGTLKAETNFSAIQSGYWQADGYVLLPGTLFRLTTGNDTNYFGDLSSITDFSFIVSGQRVVADGAGRNDGSARVYIDATPQTSGLYRITTTNPKDIVPFTSIPSGHVSFWPQGDTFSGIFSSNRMLDRSVTITSDGGLKLDPRLSTGYHVLDDALWIAGPNASSLSGTFITKGLFVMSPHNGELIWYRPAERIVATTGNMPGGGSAGSPGIFGVHLGLEEYGTDFVRISRVWEESVAPTNIFTNTVYFQRYDQTTLDHTEQSETWTITNALGSIGSRIDGLMFDGTNYWLWYEFGQAHRFDSTLTYTGTFQGQIARRRHYANGQLLYTLGGNSTVGDPVLAMSPPGGANSGIGVWSITTTPADITIDVGTFTHNSAKRLRAETHFGHQDFAIIHSIREISGATHVPTGTWMIIQFGTTLYLCKIREDASEWVVEQSIRLDHTAGTLSLPSMPTDFPYEFILHDID